MSNVSVPADATRVAENPTSSQAQRGETISRAASAEPEILEREGFRDRIPTAAPSAAAITVCGGRPAASPQTYTPGIEVSRFWFACT